MKSSSSGYSALPNDDLEMVVTDSGNPYFHRQPSSSPSAGSAETGRRVRQQNERRRERLNTDLLNAVSRKDPERVDKLLSDGASGKACCRESGITALHIAAFHGDIASFKHLFNHGGDIIAKDGKGREPVHMAAWNNQIRLIEIMKSLGSDVVNNPVNETDYAEDPDVLDSWNHNHSDLGDLIPIFLERGVTPLHIASMRGFHKCVTYLIEAGANINAITSTSISPIDVAGLHMAKEESLDNNTEELKFHSKYLDAPAGGEIAAKFLTQIHKRSVEKRQERTVDPLLKIYNDLMNSGATLPKGKIQRRVDGASRAQTKKTTTPLHTAVMRENVEVIRFLLDRGACLLTWNSEEETALHLAVRERLFEPLKTMLYWDAEQLEKPDSHWESKVDVRDGQGLTPLLLAAKLQWADGVAILLEECADVTVSSNKNETVLTFAARLGDASMMKEFLSAPNCSKILEGRDNYNYTPACCAVESKSLDCLKLLSSCKANLAVTLPGNITLLHIAAEINSPEIVEFLLQDDIVIHQGLVNTVCKSEKGGVAPIHTAAVKGYHDCVKELIKGGCDIGVKTLKCSYRGSTALHLAAQRGHLEVLELILLKDTTSHEARNEDLWTPLHLAAANSHVKCVRALLWCGADLAAAVRDESGRRTTIDLIMLCIPQPVDFLEEVFDSYISMEGESMSDDEAKITIKYNLLVPDDRHSRQLKVLNALLNSGKIDSIQKLLLHPLVETFLHLKWQKLKIFFIVIMFLYVIQTASLTVYAHVMYIERTTSPTVLFCANIASILLIAVDILILFLEVINLIQLQRYYITDIESLVKWGMIVTSFIVGLADPTFTWTKYIAATAVLLSWIELLFLLARCPSWGYYVLMFSRVAMNVLKVLGTFVLLFIGFTFSFLILFEATEPFRNFFEAFMKVVVMMLEFDYQNMFEPVKDIKALSITGRLVFISFVILVSIVMMNLMLGLAVSDISALKAQGKTQRLVKQVQFLSLLEIVVYNRTLKKLLPPTIYETFEGKRAVDGQIIVRPGKPIESINHTLPKKLREAVIDSIWSKTNNDEVEVTINLQDINQKIEELADKVKNNHSSSSSSLSGSLSSSDVYEIIYLLNQIQKDQKVLKDRLDTLNPRAPLMTSTVFHEMPNENRPSTRI